MTTINVSLPDSLKSYIDQQINQGHYQNINEYVCELIRQDQERQNLKQSIHHNPYPLRNQQPYRYDDPFEPAVDPQEWDALK